MSAPVEPGTILAGKFRVDEILGRGGMGVVVAAQHLRLDESVAIKLLLPHALANPEVVARFAQEARAAVKIKSEHVARVSDVGTLDNGAPYMVMERLNGHDLGSILHQQGRLAVEDAVDYVLQASEAVAEAHALGIVHRDLKPSNLFLVHRADGSPCVKVLDFGISKMLEPGGMHPRSGLTQSSVAMGSPNYMSPEQLTSARDVDTRTDVWALGAILYELLTGGPPFKAESFAELCTLVLTTRPGPLAAINPAVPPELEQVILSTLERDREQRIQDVSELAQRIVSFAPKHSRLSAERIRRVLQGAGLGHTAAVFPPSTDPAPGPSLAQSVALASTGVPSQSGTSEPAPLQSVAPAPDPADERSPSGPPQSGTTLASTPSDPPAQSGSPAHSETMSGLGQTVSRKRSSRVWALALAAGAVAAGAVALTRVRSPDPAQSSLANATIEATGKLAAPGSAQPAITPEQTPPPPEVTPVASATAPAASASTPAGASAVPTSLLPRPKATASKRAKPSCDPNYYFDAQGEKHFKAECF